MIFKEFYGNTQYDQQVYRFTLVNRSGTRVSVLTYGGIIQSFFFRGIDIVLGFDNLQNYELQDAYIGAIIGRFANRIGNGVFPLNNTTYHLVKNNGPNHLHGGVEGFDRKVWRAEEKDESLHLFYTSLDGEEGYPGNLETEVVYHLDEENCLSIEYKAATDKNTIVNLTNHSYFNLNGHSFGTLEEHEVQIFGDTFTENDENALPTGKIRGVHNTPMDFRQPNLLLDRIDEDYDQLKFGKGYDHNWVIHGDGLRPFVKARGLVSGIMMEIFSDQPGMQMYTANFLNLSMKGKNNAIYPARSGVCFETQGFPDAPNKRGFPSSVLKTGEQYRSKTLIVLH